MKVGKGSGGEGKESCCEGEKVGAEKKPSEVDRGRGTETVIGSLGVWFLDFSSSTITLSNMGMEKGRVFFRELFSALGSLSIELEEPCCFFKEGTGILIARSRGEGRKAGSWGGSL